MVTLMIQVDENLLNYLTHEAEKVDKPIEEVAVTLLEKQASLSLETLAYNAKRSESNGLLMIALAAEALGAGLSLTSPPRPPLQYLERGRKTHLEVPSPCNGEGI